MLLQGKAAIVTGGTRGIGFSVVKKFLEHGAKVALLGSRQETVDKALWQIKEEDANAEVVGYWPDLMNAEEVNDVFMKVKELYGSLDILVNNAGVSARDLSLIHI